MADIQDSKKQNIQNMFMLDGWHAQRWRRYDQTQKAVQTEKRRLEQTSGSRDREEALEANFRLVSFEVFLPVLFDECLSSCHSLSVFLLVYPPP